MHVACHSREGLRLQSPAPAGDRRTVHVACHSREGVRGRSLRWGAMTRLAYTVALYCAVPVPPRAAAVAGSAQLRLLAADRRALRAGGAARPATGLRLDPRGLGGRGPGRDADRQGARAPPSRRDDRRHDDDPDRRRPGSRRRSAAASSIATSRSTCPARWRGSSRASIPASRSSWRPRSGRTCWRGAAVAGCPWSSPTYVSRSARPPATGGFASLRTGPRRGRGDRGAERRRCAQDRVDRRTAARHRRDREHEVRHTDAREPARGGGGVAAHVGAVARHLDRGEHARRGGGPGARRFERVLDRLPESMLVLVPRHPERFREVAAHVRRRGFDPVMRSGGRRTAPAPGCSSATPWASCPCSTRRRTWRSWAAPWSSAADTTCSSPPRRGCRCCSGRTCSTSPRSAGGRLIEAGGARTVADSAGLGRAVVDYLHDADLRHATGAKGRAFVESNRGARRSRARDDRPAPGARDGGSGRLTRLPPRTGEAWTDRAPQVGLAEAVIPTWNVARRVGSTSDYYWATRRSCPGARAKPGMSVKMTAGSGRLAAP